MIFSQYSEESKMMDGMRELEKVDSDEKNISNFVDWSGWKKVGGILLFFDLCWAVSIRILYNNK